MLARIVACVVAGFLLGAIAAAGERAAAMSDVGVPDVATVAVSAAWRTTQLDR